MDFVKVTLFTNDRSDSILLKKHNSCDKLKNRLQGYTGEFILIDNEIKYTEVKVEHPRFTTQFSKLNTLYIAKDSIDVFNKRHHILIFHTTVSLEKECDNKPEFDFLFLANETPQGGYIFRDQIGVLLHNTLPDSLLSKFSHNFKIDLIEKDSSNKILRFRTRDLEIKDGKNKLIRDILLDSLIVKDAGVMIDTIENSFLSSFIKVASLPIKDIEKFNFFPISGLKKLTSEMNYIKNKKLEYGCGLYRCKTGLGYNLFELQNNVKLKRTNIKCDERAELLALELEYFKLKTHNLSSSGGKYDGKKRERKTNKMVKIYAREKEIKLSYYSKLGRVGFYLIK
jgi:hypothetical protein